MDRRITREGIQERVLAAVAEVFAVDGTTIGLDASIEEDLAANSVDLVTLAMVLEEEFGGEVSEKDVLGVKTVRDIVDYIECKLRTT